MSKRSAKKGATDGAATKKACTGTAGGDSQPKPAQVEEEEKNNVFSHDLDTLQCDICFTPFRVPNLHVQNGHAACGNCCVRLHRKCPSCNESIGDIRCRAMEKILAGMTRPCKYKKHGCKHVLSFTEVRIHEEDTCLYAPYRCPFGGCTYIGRHFFGHMLDPTAHVAHFDMDMFGRVTVTLERSMPFRVILQNILDVDGKSVFLLLNGGDVPTGRSLSVVRIHPRPAPGDEDGGAEAAQQYTVVVNGNQPASLSLTASGNVPFVRRIEGYKAQEFLFVPDACWGSSQTVTVTVKL